MNEPTDNLKPETIKLLKVLMVEFNISKDNIKKQFNEISSRKSTIEVPINEREKYVVNLLFHNLQNRYKYRIGYLITEQDNIIKTRILYHKDEETEDFNLHEGEKVVGVIPIPNNDEMI